GPLREDWAGRAVHAVCEWEASKAVGRPRGTWTAHRAQPARGRSGARGRIPAPFRSRTHGSELGICLHADFGLVEAERLAILVDPDADRRLHGEPDDRGGDEGESTDGDDAHDLGDVGARTGERGDEGAPDAGEQVDRDGA